MSKNRKSFLPLLAFAALLVTGALNRQVLFSTGRPERTERPAYDRDLKWMASEQPPEQLIQAFLARYSTEQVQWLRTKIWQRMNLPESDFESSGTLVLGPEGCAHLTMQVHGSHAKTALIVVSDGKVLAKSVRIGTQKPMVTASPLPGPEAGNARSMFLAGEGCCGPDWLVRRTMTALKNVKVENAAIGKNPLLRIQGEIASEATGCPLPPGKLVTCTMYFDAKTNWLTRVEWALATNHGVEPFLEMEYQTPVLNQPLSDEECAREFTFQNDT